MFEVPKELWEAARTAGPFASLILLVVVGALLGVVKMLLDRMGKLDGRIQEKDDALLKMVEAMSDVRSAYSTHTDALERMAERQDEFHAAFTQFRIDAARDRGPK